MYDHAAGKYRFVDNLFGRTLSPENLQSGFLRYLDCHHSNSSFVARVAAQFVNRLRDIRDYFDIQEEDRFFSSSLLFVYDADLGGLNIPNMEPRIDKSFVTERTDIFMIDFGHIFPIQDVGSAPKTGPSKDMKDEGYLHGTNRLIREFELLSLAERS